MRHSEKIGQLWERVIIRENKSGKEQEQNDGIKHWIEAGVRRAVVRWNSEPGRNIAEINETDQEEIVDEAVSRFLHSVQIREDRDEAGGSSCCFGSFFTEGYNLLSEGQLKGLAYGSATYATLEFVRSRAPLTYNYGEADWKQFEEQLTEKGTIEDDVNFRVLEDTIELLPKRGNLRRVATVLGTVDGMTQGEISDDLGLQRQSVVRTIRSIKDKLGSPLQVAVFGALEYCRKNTLVDRKAFLPIRRETNYCRNNNYFPVPDRDTTERTPASVSHVQELLDFWATPGMQYIPKQEQQEQEQLTTKQGQTVDDDTYAFMREYADAQEQEQLNENRRIRRAWGIIS